MSKKMDKLKRNAEFELQSSTEFLLITKQDDGNYLIHFSDLLESGEMVVRYSNVYLEQMERIATTVTNLLEDCGVSNKDNQKFDEDMDISTTGEREEMQAAHEFFEKLIADEEEECKNAKSDKPKKED